MGMKTAISLTPDQVTALMNRVVGLIDEPRDQFVLAGARSVLERSEW